MALHYGVKAANYRWTPDDLENLKCRYASRPYRERLFGLTIEPQRLAQVRGAQTRQQVRHAAAMPLELAQADKLFRRDGITALNTTHTRSRRSRARSLAGLGIEKHMF